MSKKEDVEIELGVARFAVKEGESLLGYINMGGFFIPNTEQVFSAEVLVLIAKKCDLVRTTMESLSSPPTR